MESVKGTLLLRLINIVVVRRQEDVGGWAAADKSSAAKGDSLRATPLADEKKVRSCTACDDVYTLGRPTPEVVQHGSERRFRCLCGRIRISLARSAFWTFWTFSTSRWENTVDAADLS